MIPSVLRLPWRAAAIPLAVSALAAGCARGGLAEAAAFPRTTAGEGAIEVRTATGEGGIGAARRTDGEGGIDVAWTVDGCTAARTDDDLDGLDDACELALAQAFAPVLTVEAGACGWDDAADPPRPGGGYLFGVHPAADGAVRIAYLPAYRVDCGWSGPKCLLLRAACEGHTGDSELIAIHAVPAGGATWRADAVFLSAHCFDDAACRWYAGRDLDRFAWADGRRGGAPVVWVARGTNANHPTRAACDRAHWFLDTCDANATTLRFPVVSHAQNVGSPERPFLGRAPDGCLAAADVPGAGNGDARECFWSEQPFRGWTRAGEGTPPTPYVVYLRALLLGG